MQIIDLSQEIHMGMPMHHTQPQVEISVHATHEAWEGIENARTQTPSVNLLKMSEHTGTHVDALSHMSRTNAGQTIETMPLEKFYTRGICLDLSYKQLSEEITKQDLQEALAKRALTIEKGDTILLHTDHYRRHFKTPDWPNNPGLTEAATRWLGEQQIAAFGVESMAPGIKGKTNKQVHKVCGELGFTHYENLINLHRLIYADPFQFIGLPLRIKGGTGSPVRAVAILP